MKRNVEIKLRRLVERIIREESTGIYLMNEYYDDADYNDPVASAKTKGIRTYKDSGDAEADAIEYVGGPREWAKLTRAEKEDILFDMEKGKMQSYRF